MNGHAHVAANETEARLLKQIEKLKKRLDARDENLSHFEQENVRLQNEDDKKTKELEEKELQIAELHEAVEDVQTESANKDKVIGDLKQENEDLQELLQARKDEADKFKELEELVEDREYEFRHMTNEIYQIKTQRDDAQTEVRGLEVDKASLDEDLRNKDEEIESLRNTLAVYHRYIPYDEDMDIDALKSRVRDYMVSRRFSEQSDRDERDGPKGSTNLEDELKDLDTDDYDDDETDEGIEIDTEFNGSNDAAEQTAQIDHAGVQTDAASTKTPKPSISDSETQTSPTQTSPKPVMSSSETQTSPVDTAKPIPSMSDSETQTSPIEVSARPAMSSSETQTSPIQTSHKPVMASSETQTSPIETSPKPSMSSSETQTSPVNTDRPLPSMSSSETQTGPIDAPEPTLSMTSPETQTSPIQTSPKPSMSSSETQTSPINIFIGPIAPMSNSETQTSPTRSSHEATSSETPTNLPQETTVPSTSNSATQTSPTTAPPEPATLIIISPDQTTSTKSTQTSPLETKPPITTPTNTPTLKPPKFYHWWLSPWKTLLAHFLITILAMLLCLNFREYPWQHVNGYASQNRFFYTTEQLTIQFFRVLLGFLFWCVSLFVDLVGSRLVSPAWILSGYAQLLPPG